MSDKCKPPEWWTAENTAAWVKETWGNPEEWKGAQREWGEKLRGGSKAGPACYRPLTAQELTAMRAKDPRPAKLPSSHLAHAVQRQAQSRRMRDVSPTHNSALPAAILLRRHISGDWGDVPAEDAQANEDALQTGARLLSAYTLSSGVKVWVITEADRSSTTIMLPEEY
jgi:hypothetical protein